MLGDDSSDLCEIVGEKVDVQDDEMDFVRESFKMADGWSEFSFYLQFRMMLTALFYQPLFQNLIPRPQPTLR